jgi:aminodeoxyfutalosine deaminase
MPKADLHVHLVGSAAPATVAALAARHTDSGVPADAGELGAFYKFRDFPHFLDVYKLVSDLVRSPEDVITLAAGMAEDMARQGTVYAEVTVTPVSHISAGIHPGELAQALDVGAAAARSRGVEVAWVYDISALVERDGAHRTLDAAGEVWAAIDELGAKRIGHGIAAAADPRLLDRLREDGITLEICPSSNVATGVVPSLAAHPLPRLLAAGVPDVPVVLGSDDPPMFGTSLLEEYRRVRDHLGLTDHQQRALARASFEASFAPPTLKQRLAEPRAVGGDPPQAPAVR